MVERDDGWSLTYFALLSAAHTKKRGASDAGVFPALDSPLDFDSKRLSVEVPFHEIIFPGRSPHAPGKWSFPVPNYDLESGADRPQQHVPWIWGRHNGLLSITSAA